MTPAPRGPLSVAVVAGGRSSEAEVSRTSAAHVAGALRTLGHRCTVLECDEELWEALKAGGYDVAFLALHGRNGEDGVVQGVCELAGVPYTGSDVLASALAFNKAMAKRVLAAAGIDTPAWRVVGRNGRREDSLQAMDDAAAELGLPLVVKPNRSGSTIGLAIVGEPSGLEAAFDAAAWHDDVLCERFVTGMEVTVGIVGHNPPRALPTLEIISHRPLYDYAAKYTVGASEHIIPARLPGEQNAAASDVALRAHDALGCRAISRVDVIVDAAGVPWVLEVNTIPGLTEISLLP
ncbi:MAG TPA: D-alanine--D-alanine ligase, partial [Candidatus Dormibacteraeota bacterium]|nr:D-alanine--D-alanine ligase [Candidatus Dormibacteraeota bacterium]